MPTQTPRLDIAAPTSADDFNTAEIAANWGKVDDHPGIYICTLATRPTWGSAHEGMLIYERDTDLYWRWDGSSFVREFPRGLLTTPATRTTPLVESGGTFASVTQLAGVLVPAGNRGIQVAASWYGVLGDDAEVELRRGSTTLAKRRVTEGSGGSSLVFLDRPGAGGGSFTYTARFRTLAAESTLQADSDGGQFTLSVVEV